MSLKAKIEAIIYASEEPVTLQQLVGVLGQEAQSELDALDGRQATLPLLPGLAEGPGPEENFGEANDQDALNSETLSESEADSDEPSEAEASVSAAAGTAPLTVVPAEAAGTSGREDQEFREGDQGLDSPAQTPHAEASAESGEVAPDPVDGLPHEAQIQTEATAAAAPDAPSVAGPDTPSETANEQAEDALDAERDRIFLDSGEALASPAQTPHAEASVESAEIEPEFRAAAGTPAQTTIAAEDAGFRESGEFLASPAQTPHAEASAESGEIAPEPTDAELKRRQKEREKRLRDYIRSILDELVAEHQRNTDSGLEIREIASGFRFATKPEFHDAVRGFVRSLKPPLKLSIQALETLAVVAYRQPVTAPEVSEIRGVDSGGVLGSLLTRKLVTTAGRKQVIGRPILYKTTKEFLLRFGLKDLSELPSIEEFDRIAGELNEAIQEEMPMADSTSSPALNERNAPTEAPGARRESTGTDAAEPGRTVDEVEQGGELPSQRDVHGSQADGTPLDDLTPRPGEDAE